MTIINSIIIIIIVLKDYIFMLRFEHYDKRFCALNTKLVLENRQ